jgi:hypothetical protein
MRPVAYSLTAYQPQPLTTLTPSKARNSESEGENKLFFIGHISR